MKLSLFIFRRLFLNLVSPKRNLSSSSSINKFTSRSHTCGELRTSHVGLLVNVCGWLEFQRTDKFAILRDAYGSVQVIIPEERKDLIEKLVYSPLESVVSVEGIVSSRPESQVNKNLPTGEIEIIAKNYNILNRAKDSLPFIIRGYNKPKEGTRMMWRYLDLRFPSMQKTLRLRSQVIQDMRSYLSNQGFVEVETPTLFKRTPGGAQEYIVPTQHPGEFYALVQSPQQLKQLLMIGGMDRYYQIARCYRNEGARPDRQPEFTQLDIEMSFSDMEGVIALMEGIIAASWPSGNIGPIPLPPFKRMKYFDVFDLYGTDKPDLSSKIKIQNLHERVCTAPLNNYFARLLVVPKGAVKFSNAIKRLLEEGKNRYFKNCRLFFIKCINHDEWLTSLKKMNLPIDGESMRSEYDIQDGDLVIIATGSNHHSVTECLGKMRTELLSHGLLEKTEGDWNFVWLTDFPLFETTEDGTLQSKHHPFTQPHPEDISLLKTDPLKIRGLHYDLVLNGNEVAGGSVRIHDSSLQQLILKMLGINLSSLQHIIDALAMGAPPHAGIAMGLDRYMSLLVGASSIRDVIAFPKTIEGRDTMSQCPSKVTDEELKLYNISVISKDEDISVKEN